MSATEIVHELSKLTRAERQVVLEKLRDLARQEDDDPTRDEGAIDLRKRGIGEGQAADLRARLQTFSDDWNRPEASIYDEDPAR